VADRVERHSQSSGQLPGCGSIGTLELNQDAAPQALPRERVAPTLDDGRLDIAHRPQS
jgi:hypothetical protein